MFKSNFSFMFQACPIVDYIVRLAKLEYAQFVQDRRRQ